LELWERRFFSAMHILIGNIRFQTMKLLFWAHTRVEKVFILVDTPKPDIITSSWAQSVCDYLHVYSTLRSSNISYDLLTKVLTTTQDLRMQNSQLQTYIVISTAHLSIHLIFQLCVLIMMGRVAPWCTVLVGHTLFVYYFLQHMRWRWMFWYAAMKKWNFEWIFHHN
jgi:hypothetical protein